VLQHAVIDTSRFVGNAPGHARLSDAGTGAELLPRTRLIPDTEHRFRIRPTAAGRAAAGPTAAGPTAAGPTAAGPGDPVTGVVRLDIYPDGGISRLRLEGVVPPDRREQIARRWLDLLPGDVAATLDQDEFFD
jgi:allantoicase